MKSSFISVFTFCLLLITQVAYADFKKALEALQNQDGKTMLAEVKNAVQSKSDEGLILYLSILKQYPNTWRPTLSEHEKTELFTALENITLQSTLQSQYRLAIISRVYGYPRLNSPEAIQETQSLVLRLEPVANKGYAYAALHLYGIYANHIKNNHYNAINWLTRSAELGNAEAAFLLGMKYLNIVDDYYGCFRNDATRCLPKDEVKGWYWMQQAAMRATEQSIFLRDLAYEMGNLYRLGVGEERADIEEAYLWYLVSMNSFGSYGTYDKAESNINELRKNGQLKQLDPTLDKVWNDPSKRRQVINSTKTAKSPKLIKRNNSNKQDAIPVFSLRSFSWFGASQQLDIYADGKVNLLISTQGEDLENNTENWQITEPKSVSEFMGKLKQLVFYKTFQNDPDLFFCENGCPDATHYIITVNDTQGRRFTLLNNRGFSNHDGFVDSSHSYNFRLIQILALIDEYLPFYQLQCDSDVGLGKQRCIQINKNIIKASKLGHK